MNELDFNVGDYMTDEPASYEPLPAGEYVASVTKAEVRQMKSGNGTLIAVEFTVAEGAFSGRKVFRNYNTGHRSETPQRIARVEFARLVRATMGEGIPSSTEDILGYTVRIKVKVDGDYNVVQAVFPATSTPAKDPMPHGDLTPLLDPSASPAQGRDWSDKGSPAPFRKDSGECPF